MIDQAPPPPAEQVVQQKEKRPVYTSLSQEQIENLRKTVNGVHVVYLNLMLDGDTLRRQGKEVEARKKYFEAASAIQRFLKVYDKYDLFPQLKISLAKAYAEAEKSHMAIGTLWGLSFRLAEIYEARGVGHYNDDAVKFDGYISPNLVQVMDLLEELLYNNPPDDMDIQEYEQTIKAFEALMRRLQKVTKR